MPTPPSLSRVSALLAPPNGSEQNSNTRFGWAHGNRVPLRKRERENTRNEHPGAGEGEGEIAPGIARDGRKRGGEREREKRSPETTAAVCWSHKRLSSMTRDVQRMENGKRERTSTVISNLFGKCREICDREGAANGG